MRMKQKKKAKPIYKIVSDTCEDIKAHDFQEGNDPSEWAVVPVYTFEGVHKFTGEKVQGVRMLAIYQVNTDRETWEELRKNKGRMSRETMEKLSMDMKQMHDLHAKKVGTGEREEVPQTNKVH